MEEKHAVKCMHYRIERRTRVMEEGRMGGECKSEVGELHRTDREKRGEEGKRGFTKKWGLHLSKGAEEIQFVSYSYL